MPILGELRRHSFDVCLDNLMLTDESLATTELMAFRDYGGSGFVDCTVSGMGRDANALLNISNATGVHIVAGTGLYVESFHPAWVRKASVDDITKLFIQEITEGIEGTNIRAGIIGEIGTSGVRKGAPKAEKEGDYTEEEEKVLHAAAKASIATGAAISLHLDRRGYGGKSVVSMLLELGVPPTRIVAGHMDLCEDIAYDCAVAELGVFVQYDGFGREYYMDNVGVSYPKDDTRIRRVMEMLEKGYRNQLLLSLDICTKIDLKSYGGYGYGHLLRTIAPLLRAEGVSENDLDRMLIENPKRLLALDHDVLSDAGAELGANG